MAFFYISVIVCIGIIECKIKTVTLEIKNGSVEKDNDNPLHCDGFNRILLKTYTYKPKNKDESDIVNPELLFAACSWKENCSLSQALVKKITGNTNQGFLYIKHGCPGKLYHNCVSLESTNMVTFRFDTTLM